MGLFSGRNEKLETMNRILTEAARERAKRVEELERRVARVEELERRVAQLEQELEPARNRLRELQKLADERAHLLNSKDEELALVRETLTKCLFRNRDLEQALLGQK
jgi:cell shape-determining protein MreC